MALFGRYAWEDEPENPARYPPTWRESVRLYQYRMQLALYRETQALTRLDIPLPVMKAPLSFTAIIDEQESQVRKKRGLDPFCGVTKSYPKFELPPHLRFSVRELPKLRQTDDDNDSYDVNRLMDYALSYFICADPETLQRAQEDFKKSGLAEVLRQYPGLWLNRDPYALFHILNSAPTARSDCHNPNEHAAYCVIGTDVPIIPPKKLQGIDLSSVPHIAQMATTFYHVLNCCNPHMPHLTDLFVSQPIPDFISDRILDHPVPLVNYLRKEADYIPLKLLPQADTTPAVFEQFLVSLKGVSYPIYFSIKQELTSIRFKFRVAKEDRGALEHQLSIHFPESVILEAEPMPRPKQPFQFLRLSVSSYFQFFKRGSDFSLDPYAQLFPLLSQTDEDVTSFTVVFYPAAQQFIETITSELKTISPESFGYRGTQNFRYSHYDQHFKNVKAALENAGKALQRKLPAFWAAVYISSTNPELLENIFRNFLGQYETSGQKWHRVDADRSDIFRFNLYSSQELAALLHFPGKDIDCDRLEQAMKAPQPPNLFAGSGVQIGFSTTQSGATITVTIPEKVRDRHLYLVGKTRTGKSTLLFNIAVQDIVAGRGVAVIDPHGDFVEELLHYIPQERIQDTIYFDATDREHLIPLGILNAQNEEEIGLLADDLLIAFRRLSDSWGERMESILRYTFHTLLRVQGARFLDVQHILQNQDERERMLSQIRSGPIIDFWRHQYPRYPGDAAAPILSRMSKFVLSPLLSALLSRSDSQLNFHEVIQNKKIFLANISQGSIGEDTAKLVGSLLVSQIQLAIMRRARLAKEIREPYYLFVDEFQNFASSAFDKILSEAGKYKLSLTLAHQYISQLDDKTRNAILGNVGTIIMFQSNAQDAHALRSELGAFSPDDLANLDSQSAHEVLCRPATRSSDTFKLCTLPPLPAPAVSYRPAIVEYTRATYGSDPHSTAKNASQAPKDRHNEASSSDEKPHAKRTARDDIAPAVAKEFSTNQDKALFYINQAGYLSTRQIIQLCYAHLAVSARATVASRDLRGLVAEKRLKGQPFGKEKIYYTSRTCNPTTHNLAIRDLFVKIVRSGFELAEVNFFPDLKTLTPDLSVSFLAQDGSLIKTFWEYDTGTEGVGEMIKKVRRYEPHSADSLITIVVTTAERLSQLRRAISEAFVTYAVMNDFETLNETAFKLSENETPFPFFP